MPLLLAWLIHGVVLAATIYGGLRLTRGPSAAMRYAVYWSALIVVLALPLASRARVPSFLPLISFSTSPPLADARAAAAVSEPASAASTAAATTTVSVPAVPAASQWSWPVVQLPRLPDWLVAIAIGLWLGTVLLGLLRIALGIDAIQRLKQSCRPFPAARARRLTGWDDARGRGRPVELCLCDDVSSASFLGLTRPVIAISPALAATLSDEELDLTVLHEFAHVQRRDDWTKLAQLSVMAICGWHPAVRLLDRAIDLERESACDDWVVRATGAPRSYARCLVKIAETMPRATAALVPGAHASEAPMETRIKRLLDRGRARDAWSPLPAAATAVAMAMLALVITHASPLPLIVRTATPPQQIDVARHDATHMSDIARDDAARKTEQVNAQASLAIATAAEPEDQFVAVPAAARIDRAARRASTQTPAILMASMFPSLRQQPAPQLTPRDVQPPDASMIAEPIVHEPGERANSSLSTEQTQAQPQTVAPQTPAAVAAPPTSIPASGAAAAEPRAGTNAVADDDDDDSSSASSGRSAADEPNAEGHGSWGAGAVGNGMKTAGVAAGGGVRTAGLATGDSVKSASLATGRATGTAAAKTGDGLKKAGVETAHAFSRAKRAFGSIF